MRHCPLKCVNNLSKKSGNDIFSVKDKNRIFTGYQIFVTVNQVKLFLNKRVLSLRFDVDSSITLASNWLLKTILTS